MELKFSGRQLPMARAVWDDYYQIIVVSGAVYFARKSAFVHRIIILLKTPSLFLDRPETYNNSLISKHSKLEAVENRR